MTQLENLTVWQLWYFKAVTSYRDKHFQVPTRQFGEYKVDLTRRWQAVVSHTTVASNFPPYLFRMKE
jgi:hypothetical protein